MAQDKKTKNKKKKKKKSSVMAKWGKKKWVFSAKKIMPIENDLAISFALNDKNKREKVPITFSYTPKIATGSNVRKEIASWQKLIGKSYPLYVGKKRFGPAYMKLTSANADGIETYAAGAMLTATISLTFEENRKKSKVSSKKKTNSKLDKTKTTKKKKTKSKR